MSSLINFLNLLKETEDSKLRARLFKNIIPSTHRLRTFEAIQIGDYKLSIQASALHYCEPQLTLEDLTQYKSMEIAIVKNGEWLNPRTDDYIKQFPRYDELIECYEDGERPVGAYVPVDLIEDLFKHLCKGV